MNALKNPKAVALVSTLLFVGSLFWLMNVKRVNTSLESGLETERLRSESLLSENLLLQKEIMQFKEDLASLSGKNADLDRLVQTTSSRLAEKEAEAGKLKGQVASLNTIKKQRDELAVLRQELQSKLNELQGAYAKLVQENSELNSTVALLESKNKMLSDDLKNAMLASLDQSKVEALKGKQQRLTVKARRTSKLMATFEVPSDLNNLSYRLKDTEGKIIRAESGTIASRVISNDAAFASTGETMPMNRLKKIEMVYLPKERLKAGTYTVEILNDNLYVGSLNVRLR